MIGFTRKATIGLVGLAMTACELPLVVVDTDVHVRGSGRLASEDRFGPPFHSISAHGGVVVVVERTGRERVRVTAEDNLLRYIESEVRSGVLHVGPRHGVSIQARREMLVHIEAVEVVEIHGSGAVDIEVHLGRWQPELWIALSGASSLWTTGKVDRQEVDLSGASEYDGLELLSERARITASGASRAWLHVHDRLDAVASGASQVWFAGRPRVFAHESGAATVRPY